MRYWKRTIFGKGKSKHTLKFDDRDVRYAMSTKWYAYERAPGCFYAVSHQKQINIQLHRLILPDSILVDHINGDGLDNRRMNIRAATKAMNANNRRLEIRNKSGFNGVAWETGKNKYSVWYYSISGDRKSRKSKSFSYGHKRTQEEALTLAVNYRRSQDIKTGCTNGVRPKRM